MSQVYKRKQGKDKDGNPKVDKNWTATFRLPSGLRASIALFADKEASEEAASSINKMIALAATDRPLTPKLWNFVVQTDSRIRKQLVVLGIVPGEVLAASSSLQKLIDQWDATRSSRSQTSQEQSKKRVVDICEGCGFRALQEVNAPAVDRFLTGMKKSARTYNLYLTNLKTFLNWTVTQGMLLKNPVLALRPKNVSANRKLIRRAGTEAEIKTLLASNLALGIKHHGLEAYERDLVYRLEFVGGLRWHELATTKVQDFHLDGEIPFVLLQGRNTKNGKARPVVIDNELAQDLAAYFSNKNAEDRAFDTWKERGAQMLRQDLEAAGIPYKDADGRVLDFHALRHTCGTRMANNDVPPLAITNQLGHYSTAFSLDVYGHDELGARAAAVQALPALPAQGKNLVHTLVNNKRVKLSKSVQKQNNSDTQTKNKKTRKTQGFRANEVGREKGLEPSAFRATICGPVENEPINHGNSEDPEKLSQQISQQAAEAAKMASYIDEAASIREDMARMGADMAALDKTINYLTRALANLAAQLSTNNPTLTTPALPEREGEDSHVNSASVLVATTQEKEN